MTFRCLKTGETMSASRVRKLRDYIVTAEGKKQLVLFPKNPDNWTDTFLAKIEVERVAPSKGDSE